MAWIMKNSAGTKIPKRPEPYLTAQMQADLTNRVLPRYPTKRAATLPALHMVQEAHGWVPYQAMEEIAAFLEMAASDVADTASFYEMYHFEPKGKYVIWVCQSISCEIMGEKKLMHALEKKLGIEAGQTTPDGRFTLMHAECLGSCGTAPVALVNENLHENLTIDNFGKLLDGLP